MTHSSLRTGSAPRKTAPTFRPWIRPGLVGRDLLDELALEERLELEAAELVDQVGGRLAGSLAPPAAELGRRQLRDDCLQPLLLGPGGDCAWARADEHRSRSASRGPDQQRANDRSRVSPASDCAVLGESERLA